MQIQGKVVSTNVYVWNKYKHMSKDDDDADFDYDDDDDDDDDDDETKHDDNDSDDDGPTCKYFDVHDMCLHLKKTYSRGNITANVTQVPLPKTAPGV